MKRVFANETDDVSSADDDCRNWEQEKYFSWLYNRTAERQKVVPFLTTTWYTHLESKMKQAKRFSLCPLHKNALRLLAIVCNLHLPCYDISWFIVYLVASISWFLSCFYIPPNRFVFHFWDREMENIFECAALWTHKREAENKRNMTNCSFVLWNYGMK